MDYIINKCMDIDDLYPKALGNISKRLSCICYAVNIDILNSKKCVAIVGRRNCSAKAAKLSALAGKRLMDWL